MLENIRKYSALMTIVIVLIAVSLIFASSGEMNMRGNAEMVSVNGESMPERKAQTEILAVPNLLRYISRSPELTKLRRELGSYEVHLTTMTSYKDENVTYMPVINQMLINEEAKKLGIFVSIDDAKNYIKTSLFADENGQTDFSTYNDFVDSTLKKANIKEEDFEKMVVNMLTYQKLVEIKSPANLPFSFATRIADIGKQGIFMGRRAEGNQTIDATIVQFAVADFKDKVEATDEEAKAFFEENKHYEQYIADFRTDKQLKLTYFTVNFNSIDTPEEITEKNPEDFAKVAELTAKAEEALEKSTENYKTYKKFISDEDFARDASNLEDIAKKYGYEVKTTELVGPDKLTDFIPDYPALKKAQRYFTLHNYLYTGNIKKNDSIKVRIPGQIQSSYIYYRIDEEKAPETKTFEQAKESAKKLLIDDLAIKAANKAASDAKSEIEQALKDKKDVQALITEKGWKHFNEAIFSLRTGTEDLQLIRELFYAARHTAPQTVTDVQENGQFASIAYVKKREIEKIDGFEVFEANTNKAAGAQFARLAFDEWITEKFFKSDIKYAERPEQGK